jgi:hypothetical protein
MSEYQTEYSEENHRHADPLPAPGHAQVGGFPLEAHQVRVDDFPLLACYGQVDDCPP